MQFVRWLGVFGAVAMLAGCATQIAPGDGGGNGDGSAASDVASDVGRDAASDGGLSCTLPNGGTCPAGTSCPAGDGCNICSCPPAGGFAQCTERPCPPPDVIEFDAATDCHDSSECATNYVCVFPQGCPPGVATGSCQPRIVCDDPTYYCGCDGITYNGCQTEHPYTQLTYCEFPMTDAGPPPPRSCETAADCLSGEFCNFQSAGCNAQGTCATTDSCSLPIAPEYCGCDGVTFQETSNCTYRAYAHTGACDAADAGSCAGAAIGPGGACQGPADGALPVECCFNYDCDQRQVSCRSLTPICAAGSTPSVANSCWTGQCVPNDHCAPIACGADSDCPFGWGCNAGLCSAAPTP